MSESTCFFYNLPLATTSRNVFGYYCFPGSGNSVEFARVFRFKVCTEARNQVALELDVFVQACQLGAHGRDHCLLRGDEFFLLGKINTHRASRDVDVVVADAHDELT